MSFWDLNDGSKAESVTEFETGGGNLEPIPNNTGCIAAIEEAKWDEMPESGARFINLKWRVLQPSEYAKRVIFQKVKVFGIPSDKDPQKTSDKAKRMLAAIDANAGAKLATLSTEPTNEQLMSALVGKMMAIKVMIWEMTNNQTGEPMSGNWISAVAPAKGAATTKPVVPAPSTAFDSEIPF